MNRGRSTDSADLSLIRALRTGRAGVGARIIATLVSGLLAAALALAGIWAFTGWTHGAFRPPYQRFRVRDDDIAIALLVAAAVWIGLVCWVWRGRGSTNRFPLRPSLGSLAVAIGTVACMPIIDRLVVNEEEVLMTAFGLCGGALILMLWLPFVHGFSRRRRIVDPEGVVQVHCPECRYSMVGLREARCPECGAAFTLDELILRQPFATAIGRPGSESAEAGPEDAEGLRIGPSPGSRKSSA